MGFYHFDSMTNTLLRYAAVAMIAGSAGLYKGCEMGRDIGRKEMMMELYSANQHQKKNAEIMSGYRMPLLEDMIRGE